MKRQKQHMYGKAHHEKYPYKQMVFEVFEEAIGKIDVMIADDSKVLSDFKIHNSLIELRNKITCVIDEIYKGISLELSYGLKPKKPRKLSPPTFANRSLMELKCDICSEDRSVNLCHIIPRENGGSDTEDNYIYLCPTHHFLFDQARLKKSEFRKIAIKDKAQDAVDFFNGIHLRRHQMYWKYGTNKLTGCECGSQEFQYDTIRNGPCVQICLKCTSCGEKYPNPWVENHPIPRMSIGVCDMSEKIPRKEKERLLVEAENKLQAYIKRRLERKLNR